jgi:hypothetical protein
VLAAQEGPCGWSWYLRGRGDDMSRGSQQRAFITSCVPFSLSEQSRIRQGLKDLRREPRHSGNPSKAAWYLRHGLRSSQSVRSQHTATASSASGDSLRGVKFGEWEKFLGECITLSGLRGFLRKTAFRLSDHRACATRNHRGRLDDFSEMQGATKTGMMFLHLTA